MSTTFNKSCKLTFNSIDSINLNFIRWNMFIILTYVCAVPVANSRVHNIAI